MRRKATTAIFLVSLMLLTVSAAAVPSPLVGSWEALDSDGSTVRIQIAASGEFRLFDDGATICEDNGFGFVPASIDGSGEFTNDGQTLITDETAVVCYTRDGSGVVKVLDLGSAEWTYDPAKDNLLTPDCNFRTGTDNDC